MTPFLQRVLVSAFIIFGIWIAAFFGLRTFHAYREVREHRPPPLFSNEQPETDVQLIEDWMTVPFIAKMYHVPPHIIFEALNIQSEDNKEKSLKQLNDKYFPTTPGYALGIVKTTVQANLPHLSAPPPATAVSPATAIPGVSP
jgi:hypothetical protein